MSSLLIVGAGEYGQSVKEIAELCGYSIVDYLDDNSNLAIGPLDDISKLQANYNGCIVAIGNPIIRETVSALIDNLITLIHPSSVISKSARIGRGCIVEANSTINANSTIMDGTFVCSGSVVNHDAIVESYSQVDCNAVIASGTIVPQRTKVDSCTVWNERVNQNGK